MNNKKILIADDEGIVADIIKAELVSEGYDVDVVYSGSDAVVRIKENEYDLLILDNRMPGKSGMEILESVGDEFVLCNVILMTAFGTINDAVYAMKLGAVDYIQKPFDNNELINKVNDLFNQENDQEVEEKLSTSRQVRKLVGHSTKFLEFYSNLTRIRDLSATVLLIGESGTGKSAVAKEIHNTSNRSDKPFIYVNCATLPPSLVESELFGHVKGAFTGANADKKGKFEQAGVGTVFLDEISTLSIDLQAKLLTILQERQFEKVGGSKTIEFKARIISATNTNLAKIVKNGLFREDLFYRLNVITLECPPLRERDGDIEELFNFFIEKYKKIHERNIRSVSRVLIEELIKQPWHGNIRELENTVERLVAMNADGILTLKDLRSDPFFKVHEDVEKPQKLIEKEQSFSSGVIYEEHYNEYEELCHALRMNNDHREKTAQYLGISRRTLQYRIKKYKIKQNKNP